MKYRYIVLGTNGESPEGTNDDLLAQAIADSTDETWVVDCKTGIVLGAQGDTESELSEVDPGDWGDLTIEEEGEDGEAEGEED